MLYIRYLIFVGGDNIKKNLEVSIFELLAEVTGTSRLCHQRCIFRHGPGYTGLSNTT